MYFKRLEMHGFKSFAEPVVIEFHEGVTAVVGPNGSGKSNISDAIRWVLGEQSPKALRGGKMEEVIFAGTASRKSRGMAEVTLVIDNSTGILPIDYNEVAITRRMFRSGESEYMINNNHCRLRDIRELIMDTGIGVDGYSLIGQGKIADIVSNKPESRREIFEEAAGVVMYKSKKQEAEKKLSSTNQNLERANDIIGEIEGRIEGLREDSIKAKKFLELKERYQELEINIILKSVENIDEKNIAFKNEIEALSKELEDFEKRKAEIDEKVNADRNKIENLEQLGNEARDKQVRIIDEINRLSNESQLNQERLSGIEKDNHRLTEEITVLEDKQAKEQNNLTELEKTRSELSRKYEEAKTYLQEKIEYYDEMSKILLQMEEDIENGKEQMIRLNNGITGKKSEIRSIESLKETMEKRKNELADDANRALQNKGESEVQLQTARDELAGYTQNLHKTDALLNDLQQERRTLEQKSKENRVKIEDLKIKGGQKAARKRTIEEMESNYEGYNFAVKYIMRSGLSGIEGVVAELMNVPDGYETAIETALGAQMQNIICGTDQDAKRAVNALKENKAGRLTFLPVSSIKGGRSKVDSSIERAGGYKGLAVDCITFDPQYKQVFEYLLGRVAIVEDMDTAIKLSKISGSGLRFVTLDGEIINVSGAITGGKYKNKTANLLERKSEISKLEQEIDKLRDEMLKAIREDEAANQRMKEIDEDIHRLDGEKREAELSKAALESSIAAMQDALDNYDADRQRADKDLVNIESSLESADAQVEVLRDEVQQSYAKIGKIQEDTEALIDAFAEQKSVTDKASEAITETRIESNEWQNKIEHCESLLSRVQESADEYAEQIEEKKHELAQLDREKNQILFGRDDREAKTENLLKERAELEDYIKAVADERHALNENIQQISKEQQSAGQRLNDCQDKKYQTKMKLERNEYQLEGLKERLWDEFEMSYAQALDFKKSDFVLSTSQKESREVKGKMRALGEVNTGAIKEYETQSKRLEFLTEQRDDILSAMNELKAIIEENDRTIKSRFKESFDQIVDNFEDIFKELFGGGHAELRMEDENNPLESGIDIIAQPPGKKLQNINLMSGGEKTMTAIALMFAVLKTKPTPFCILDEVEAALDDANIDRFAKYLRKFNNIQFTLVTHQKATMEHADVLYGVTMPEHGISRVLSLRLGDNFEL